MLSEKFKPTKDIKEAKVDDRLSADQKAIIRNLRLPPGERYPVRGETPRDTEERLTQTRRETTARNRGGQTVRGSRGLEPWGITDRKKYFPQKISARLDKLRAKRAKNNIRPFREEKTFEEFMIEARKLAHSFPLSKDELATVQRIRDRLDGKSSPESTEKKKSSTKSASRRKPRKLDFEVREERERNQSLRPTVLPKSREGDIGKHDDWKDKPSTEWGDRPEAGKKLKRRAQTVVGTRRREDKETGVYEEFKDLTPEKEERVKNRVGELFRDVQVQDVRMKELRKKPFGKYRPKVKKEKEAILKSMKKKQNLVQNASDALIRTDVSRKAKIVKRIHDIKQKLRDLGEEP